MSLKLAFKPAIGMSLISMIAMEAAMNVAKEKKKTEDNNNNMLLNFLLL